MIQMNEKTMEKSDFVRTDALQTEILFTSFRDDFPKITTEHILTYSASFEWWYFDVEAENGDSFVILFKRRDPTAHKSKPHLHIEIKNEKKHWNKIHLLSESDFRIEERADTNEMKIHFGKSSILIVGNSDQQIEEYRINVDIPNLKASFIIRPLCQGFKIGEDGIYFRHIHDPKKFSAAIFPAPLFHAKGTINLKDQATTLEGTGYHDHTWGTADMLETHLQWHWGRIYSKDRAMIFVRVLPTKNYRGCLSFLFTRQDKEKEPKFYYEFDISPTNWKRTGLIKIPHEVSVISDNSEFVVSMVFEKVLSNLIMYVRSFVSFQGHSANQKPFVGSGWLEYFVRPKIPHKILLMLNRAKSRRWMS